MNQHRDARIGRWVTRACNGVWRCLLCGVLVSASPASVAQFYSNAIPAEWAEEEHANIYFGYARDANGDFLAGVTVVLDTGLIEYVAVTNGFGHFRLRLPTTVAPDAVRPRCSRRDFQAARVTTRLLARRAVTPVEVSCWLS